MRFVSRLGVGQAVLAPHPRPDIETLRRLGFSGSRSDVVRRALRADPDLLCWTSSASAMWTANAATVAPSTDTRDGRAHFTVANLHTMFHRSLEAGTTERVLRRIFRNEASFAVHAPLPASPEFADEGAANHTRLATGHGSVHLFGWGRAREPLLPGPARFPARQTREASAAIARLCELKAPVLSWQQDPGAIDAGAFHSDVVAVGSENVLLLHERAFIDLDRLLAELERLLGPELRVLVARDAELPVDDAVASYPFNSQLLRLPDASLAVVAPEESRHNAAARRFLERARDEIDEISVLHYVDVNASMQNGGGPACLRLRVPLTERERAAVTAHVFVDGPLLDELESWMKRHYRDRLTLDDLADPALLDELETALDELSALLGLGNVYEFQGATTLDTPPNE
jgi:succinylarginine dihydrolase